MLPVRGSQPRPLRSPPLRHKQTTTDLDCVLVLMCLCVFGSQLTVIEGVWSLVLGQRDTGVGSRQFPLNPDKELLREAKTHVDFQYLIFIAKCPLFLGNLTQSLAFHAYNRSK